MPKEKRAKARTQIARGVSSVEEAQAWFAQHAIEEIECVVPDLAGVAPALVITAEFDPLRDQGDEYAVLLDEAGVDVVHTRYEGMIHGFFGMDAGMDKAAQAQDQVAEVLKQAFAG